MIGLESAVIGDDEHQAPVKRHWRQYCSQYCCVVLVPWNIGRSRESKLKTKQKEGIEGVYAYLAMRIVMLSKRLY